MTKDQDQVHIFVRISEFYPWATAMILIDFFSFRIGLSVIDLLRSTSLIPYHSYMVAKWGRCATCRLAI
jgi:hypothetical protein